MSAPGAWEWRGTSALWERQAVTGRRGRLILQLLAPQAGWLLNVCSTRSLEFLSGAEPKLAFRSYLLNNTPSLPCLTSPFPYLCFLGFFSNKLWHESFRVFFSGSFTWKGAGERQQERGGRGSEQKGEGERNREREIDVASYSWSPSTGLASGKVGPRGLKQCH